MAKTKRSFQVPRAWRNLTLNVPLKVNGAPIPVAVDVAITTAMTDGNGIKSHYVCDEHKCSVQQAWYCAEGDHYVKPGKAYEYGGQQVSLEAAEHPSADQDGQVSLKALVPEGAVDPIYYTGTYIVWPTDDSGGQLFDTLLAVMKGYQSCLVGTTVMGKGTKMVVLRYSAALGTLVFHTCTFDARVKVSDVETTRLGWGQRDTSVDAEVMEGLYVALTDSLDNTWDASAVKDEYADALSAVLEEKIKTGKVMPKQETVRTVETTPDLFDSLRAQMKENKKDAPKKKKSAGRGHGRVAEKV